MAMAPPRRPEIVIGLDVGKPSHWAYVAAHDDEAPRQARVATGVGRYDPYVQSRYTRSA